MGSANLYKTLPQRALRSFFSAPSLPVRAKRRRRRLHLRCLFCRTFISAGGPSKPEPEAAGSVWLDVLGFLGRAASQHRPLIAAAGPGTSIVAAVLLSVLARRGGA